MSKTVEFFFDYGSPNVYIAYTQIFKIADRTGATIIWKPALLGGIFNAIGNRAPATLPPKAKWMWQDLNRFAARFGVPFKLNSHFPVNTVPHMRGALVALRDGYLQQYSDIMFKAIWIDDVNTADTAEFARVLNEGKLDAAKIMAEMQEPAIKQELFDRTAEAVERGAFGMPTFFIGDEMHYGKDRLDFVEEALLRSE